MQIILASQSPRRQELMGLFRLPFTVKVADVDESMDSNQTPEREVARVSRQKAAAVCREADDVVIAADTIVVCDGQILGKPKNEDDARRMLGMLSGKRHQVMTGLTVLRGDKEIVCTEVTDIYFRKLSEKEIDRYVQTGEPMDKAGSYAIQGGAALFAQKITGDYFNVVGLPVCQLGQILRKLAPEIMEDTE